MKTIHINDLITLGRGATLLGSGGGGDPAILYGQLHYLLGKSEPIPLLAPEALEPDTLIVPIALVGAPLISMERIPNSAMFAKLIDAVSAHYPQRKIVLMPAEIGGCNAFSPFMAAAQRGLPVLDGDLIGRAFPQLNMCKPAILGQQRQLSFVASHRGDVKIIETEDMKELESRVRELAVFFGCSAAFATFLFSAKDLHNYLIPGSVSRALALGSLLEQHSNCLSEFAKTAKATKLGAGIILEVCHRIENGFLTGYAKIKAINPTSKQPELLQVFYQNEYLLIRDDKGRLLAESPAIISLIESRSGIPLTSESLRYGLKVDVYSLAAPAFWEEPLARAQVDLKAFGFLQQENSLCIN